MKTKKQNTLSNKKKYKLSKKYLEGEGESQYARKKAYCQKNGVWGFEVPEPKPWKKSN
jgi:endonuclease YncB( thermonuclease family)